ncbi:TetR/AcrR family transcriptional regulator [Alloalcanivorax marinus]|uniref:TetR/AcrR family transcriptional regulator n=1 Tax=Alloalcanivorax marinus TaxID=1177169 RepID=UPI00193183CD|nr:helix-turn-helix domain-containing protein [Alloalcanivorax marinus]MBL7251664.1 TetR/AcrR family transcriptional regulator [Alloalcanivorax marinus]
MREKASRQRLVAGAADLLSRRGVKATSIRELAKHARAPLGSTYHYFPGGKAQLVTEAVRFIGDKVSEVLASSLQQGPVTGLQEFLALWRREVVRSDYRAGCPVLSVAVEEPDNEEGMAALAVAKAVFADWIGLLTRSLVNQGVEEQKAEQLAILVVASVEGTIALCRARRSVEPLEQVSMQLEALIRQALGE